MTTSRLIRCLAEPRLRPFLPMIYIAWADGELSDDEIRTAHARIERFESLDAGCRSTLAQWLEPDSPPTPQEMTALLTLVRESASELDRPERMTLAQLGYEIARVEDPNTEPEAHEQSALEELLEALGLGGPDASRELLQTASQPPAGPLAAELSFSPTEMTEVLEQPYAEHRQHVRKILCRPQFAFRAGEPTDAKRARTLELCRELANEGLGALAFPSAYGGGDSPGQFVATFETLALGDLSLLVKFGVQFGLFGGAVALLGTERHHEAYLREIGSLELPGCFAMTETGHGSNVRDLETVAVFDPATDELVITTPSEAARKDYIGNAALHGRLAVVFAQLEVLGERHGVHAVLAPIRDKDGEPAPGVRIEDCGHKLGLNGVDNGRIWFDEARVPRENLLNRFADVSADGIYESDIPSAGRRFFTTIGSLVGGRVSIALAALSVSKSSLAIAVSYGAHRRQFGPTGEAETPILDYPSHQLKLLPRLAATYALHFALRELARGYVESRGDITREIEARAAGLKAWATRFATDTVQECREACGGQGYLAVNRFAALKADSDVFTTFEGDNTVLLQLVAKGLLTGFRRQFEDMGVLGLMRHLAGEAAHALAELNPVSTRRTEVSHLRDPEFQLAALLYREHHLLSTVARRIRGRLEDGLEAQEAFVQCQDHLVETARAHVERLIAESFQQAVRNQSNQEIATVLGKLASLFALERIESDRGWFQEHGYLEAPKSKAIRKQVRVLCRELRSDAPALVRAFDIPQALLGAPIAREP